MNPRRRRALAAGAACALALGGCGYDRPPSGFRPASSFACPEPISGLWSVQDERALAWLTQGRPVPGARRAILHLAPRGALDVQVEMRHPVADVIAEAMTLRIAHPEAYRIWRAQALGEPGAQQRALPPDIGPTPSSRTRWSLGLSECGGGWRYSEAGFGVEGGD